MGLFHDCELLGISHEPELQRLSLRLRTVAGAAVTVVFDGAVSFDIDGFSTQNVLFGIYEHAAVGDLSDEQRLRVAEDHRWHLQAEPGRRIFLIDASVGAAGLVIATRLVAQPA